MMALSIRQPWAWLILHGGKDIENRDWPTKARGRILVHAAMGMTHAEYDEAKELYEKIRYNFYNPGSEPPLLPAFDKMVRGGFVGAVEIIGCATNHTSPWFFGSYGYVLKNPQPFVGFVPFKGRLGFFEVNVLAMFDQFKEAGAVL